MSKLRRIGEETSKRIAAFLADPANSDLSNTEIGQRLGINEGTVRAFKQHRETGQALDMNIDQIRRDESLQSRESMNESVIEDYKQAMESGDKFPPVVVFFDGEDHWLADGNHRVEAAKRAGKKSINVALHNGDKRAALLFAVGTNNDHGLRRSNADKRRVVARMLADPEWCQWSDHEIARRCKVSHYLVGKIRADVTRCAPSENSDEPTEPDSSDSEDLTRCAPSDIRKTVNKHGQETVIHVGKIGKGKSVVNGTLQDDPPDIAEKRLNGKIGPNVVPEVTTSAGPSLDSEEPTDEPHKLTDDEWLADLPLSTRLTGAALKWFSVDALLYRSLEDARATFAHHAVRALGTARKKGQNGAYAYRLSQFLKIDHPKLWRCCPATEKGGCDGVGSTMLGECPLCHGRGFMI